MIYTLNLHSIEITCKSQILRIRETVVRSMEDTNEFTWCRINEALGCSLCERNKKEKE